MTTIQAVDEREQLREIVKANRRVRAMLRQDLEQEAWAQVMDWKDNGNHRPVTGAGRFRPG